MAKKQVFYINKEITLSTNKGLKQKGDTIEASDIGESRLKELKESGHLINEGTAAQLKKEAEEAKQNASKSLEEIKKLEEAVKKAQDDLVSEKESFEAEKADFVSEKESFEAEKADFEKTKTKK